MSVKVKIKSESGRIPVYATTGSSGFDLPAYLPEGPITVKPGKRYLVPTGIYMEIPVGYEAQVRARSGLAIKKGIGLVNGVGTIDSDYRGEVGVALINLGEEDFIIHDGDRIAQMVIAAYERAQLIEVESKEDLDETARGGDGFGSSGIGTAGENA